MIKEISAYLQVFRSQKMAALLFLGFASGLPLFLTSRTLQAWMTTEGVDLKSIGLFSLVTLPYSLKFLWSPLLDRYVPPFLGRRRGWILIAQICLTLAIGFMAFQQPKQSLEGVAIGVLGYRLALILTGSIALILADHFPWPLVYLFLAGLMALTIIWSFFAPATPPRDDTPQTLLEAVWLPFQEFFQRYQIGQGIGILAFIVLYRLGDALVNNMVTPFLLKTGFSQTDIGAIQGGMGMIATMVGVLLGGSLLSRWGINRSLWIFGGLQAISNLVYFILANLGQNYPFMVLAINIENFCGGLVTAAFVAFLMSLCNARFTATQYALLSSLMAFSRDILVAPAGVVAEAIGWRWFFLITVIAALPGLALLPLFAPWQEQD